MGLSKKKPGAAKQRAFLAAYVLTAGSITAAAAAAKVDRAMHYRWLKDDSAYLKTFEDAGAQMGSVLVDEAVRRAHRGIEEPLIYRGRFSYKQRVVKDAAGNPVLLEGREQFENYGKPLCVNKKSDALLMFLIKGFVPAFRDRVLAEVSNLGGPVPAPDQALAKLSDDELATLLAITRKLTPE